MESWRKVFRYGAAHFLSTAGLQHLANALENDDPAMIQGSTTSPPPLPCVGSWPIEGACGLAYACWKGEGLHSVSEVEIAFSKLTFQIDTEIGEPGDCRWFLNWFDSSPREEMRRLLLPEVKRAIAKRLEPGSGAPSS